MSNVFKSPVNRIGGKYQLTGWLSQFMPGHVCYVEPFAGAGHLLFSKRPSPVEVINDIDGNLIGFFRVVKDTEKRSKLIETLEFMPYSRALWQDIRTRWKAGDLPAGGIKRSAWWFYLNRSTYGGDIQSGGFAMPSTTGRNPAASYQSAIDGLERVAGRLRGVTVECLDYAECVRRYDSPGTLFYIDCPYYGSEGYYSGFTEADHYELAEILHQIQGKVMVSHYNNDVYRSLYQDFTCYQRQSFKGAYKSTGESKPETAECIWTNYRPVGTRTLFGV